MIRTSRFWDVNKSRGSRRNGLNMEQSSRTKSKNYETILEKSVLPKNKDGQAWVVYLHGVCVDLVWFHIARTARDVKDALVYMDGYSVDIEVRKPS